MLSLSITAYDNEGLLGELLCGVAGLIGGGLDLTLAELEVTGQLNALLGGIAQLLNGVLGNLADAVIADIQHLSGRTCAILNLELAPVDLTLLGLNVHLDDCENGPVTVDITAVKGQLLGNLLCGLLGGGGLSLGDTLGLLIGGLLGL